MENKLIYHHKQQLPQKMFSVELLLQFKLRSCLFLEHNVFLGDFNLIKKDQE